jgi:predicted negative regulator of RcsB-dependent stress response
MSKETLSNNIQNKTLSFLKKNLKNLIILAFFLILLLFSYFFYSELRKKEEVKISGNYVEASFQFEQKKLGESKELLEKIIVKKHKFYSPLALYFIIDNNLEADTSKIINFFDEILSINTIDKENLNLIKIKKAIFLINLDDEELIIKTLNPIINSDSVWKKMAIELISEYFISKNQKSKAKEYIQLLSNRTKE